MSLVESILNYSVSRCTSVDLMHLEVISAIRRWVWITRRRILRAIKPYPVFMGARRNAAKEKMSPVPRLFNRGWSPTSVHIVDRTIILGEYAALWLQICQRRFMTNPLNPETTEHAKSAVTNVRIMTFENCCFSMRVLHRYFQLAHEILFVMFICVYYICYILV